jgi:lysophospholipid acyltransferase (LPLAT)-like uncharacterized protein
LNFKFKAVTSAAYWLAKLTNGTLRLTVKGEDKLRSLQKEGRGVILALWHGKLWIPAYYWGDRGYIALASQSRDGDYITKVLHKLGWQVVRGSTSKGGARSLLKLIKKIKAGRTVVITPDGPTGPRHQVKSGVLYLAAKTDSVIVPIGVSSKTQKEFASWDKFELPYPFSRAALVYGEPMEVEDKLSEDQKKSYKAELEHRLTGAGNRAESILEA